MESQTEKRGIRQRSRLKSPTGSLTAAEAEVMNVIWAKSIASVADVVDSVPRELAYTTVMTTVGILEDKGFVTQCGKRGRAFLYQACIDRDEVIGSMSSELANRLFAGSFKSLVLNLVQREGITASDLAEVRQLIEQLEASQ